MIGALIGDILCQDRVRYVVRDNPLERPLSELIASDMGISGMSILMLGNAECILEMDTDDIPDFVLKGIIPEKYKELTHKYDDENWDGVFHPAIYWMIDDGKPLCIYKTNPMMLETVIPYAYHQQIEYSKDLTETAIRLTCDGYDAVKAAKCIAQMIHSSRFSKIDAISKRNGIENFVHDQYYNMNFNMEDLILDKYEVSPIGFDSIPKLIKCVVQAYDFPSAMKNATRINCGREMGLIVGELAEHIFGVPNEYREKMMICLDDWQKDVLLRFEDKFVLK